MNVRSMQWLIALIACTALALSVYSYHQVAAIKANVPTVLGTMNSLLKEREDLLHEQKAEQFTEPNSGILPSYLTKIRRDGVAQHADMKMRLNALADNTASLRTLVDLYEPQAKTSEFKAQAIKLRAYAIAWTDRWNSVMDLFMAGGAYPATELPFPDQFEAALKAEGN